MKCQHCNKNEATMNLRFRMNKQNVQVNMCNTCFQEIQGQLNAGNIPSFNNDANQFFQAGGANQAQAQTIQRQEDSGNG